MTVKQDLPKLSEPFPADDVEWRVSRVTMGRNGVCCFVLAYITARAIQQRLDEVCGPDNWRNEEPRTIEMNPGKIAFSGGISIRVGEEWVTKWDVAEPTNIEAAKGGFSGAMKRAGAQWGIGRYLYHLDESFADVSEQGGKGWNYARMPEKHGGGVYYWKPPALPGWALPKDPDVEVSKEQLIQLVEEWKTKFAADVQDPAARREGFTRFVHSVCGEFPVSDHKCWTAEALYRCSQKIEETTEADGVSSDVPFEE